MANGYSVRDYLLNGSAVAVGASASETVVSSDIPITEGDSKNFKMRIITTAAKEATGITVKLQHSHTGTSWENVGSAGQIAVVGHSAADADVDSGAETVTVASHGFVTGDAVYYTSTSAITGLTTATIYYIIKSGTNDFKLATTRANAFLGTAINITQPAGAATHFFCKTEHELAMNIENSTDEAQLPLWPKARVVVDSGANDVFTVSSVLVTRRF